MTQTMPPHNMDIHRIHGAADMTVANLLDYCLNEGKIDRALKIWGYVEPDVSQIKQVVQEIVTQHEQQAAYHKNILEEEKP